MTNNKFYLLSATARRSPIARQSAQMCTKRYWEI